MTPRPSTSAAERDSRARNTGRQLQLRRLQRYSLSAALVLVAAAALANAPAVSRSTSARLRALAAASRIHGVATGGPDPELSAQATSAAARSDPTALIVTAHPDDEAMFFAPTIMGLIDDGWELSAVCLSNDGLGEVREPELYGSYATLGVPRDRVRLVDHPLLQDGMADADWDPALIANVLAPILADQPADYLITFDAAGVTRHPNHVPLSFAHALLPTAGLHDKPARTRPRLLVLRSPSIPSKFTGPLSAVWAVLRYYTRAALARLAPGAASQSVHAAVGAAKQAAEAVAARLGVPVPCSLAPLGEAGRGAPPLSLVASPAQYKRAWAAMLAHRSQLVWFRWLYMAFSRLVWVNELVYVGA